MKNKILRYLFPLVIFFVLPSFVNAAEYYVRTDGNNNCSGLVNAAGSTGACAWKTIQKAANTVVAGDTVNVADGNYAGFYVETSGAPGAPITFKSIGTGANIISRNSRTADGINIESWEAWTADYITIDGFNVYNQPRMGVRAIGGTGIIVQNTISHDNGDCGIFTGGTPNFSVLNTTTYNNGSTLMQHNIYISNADSDNPIIRGNIAYAAGGGNGIQLNGDYKEGGDGYIDNAIIENNIVYNNAAKGFSLISVRYGMIRNNITYGNHGAGGVHLVQESGGSDLTYYSVGNTVVNNTFDEAATACVRVNALNTNNVIFNNICIGATGIVFEGAGNYQSNNYSSAAGTGIFANYAGRDYHLLTNSPAKDYGVAIYRSKSAPTIDFAGAGRPQGAAYDAGAYEFGMAEQDTTPPSEPSGLSVI